MIKMKLSEIAPQLDAELVGADAEIEQVFTDSRKNCRDGLFVALRGPYFDAHDFLDEVVTQKPKALMVEKPIMQAVPQLVVADTRLALGSLARFNREQLKAKFVAITGSSGKTTVKEMLASILRNIGETFATRGNFNNDIGVPLTLLEMNSQHQFGVIELGANHPGEIAYTASLTKPDVAVINNVAAAHLQGFGDLHGVARAKGEIFSGLKPDGVAVVNNDDEFAPYWKKIIKNRLLTFSVNGEADLIATEIKLNQDKCAGFVINYQQQSYPLRLPLAGLHNVNNALAAAACAVALGVSMTAICAGLEQSPVVSGRLMSKILPNGCRFIDDTYNANLDSMRAAIELLADYSGRRILVIGDMAELGDSGRQCHQQVGEIARQSGIDALYSCGVLTQFSQTAFVGEGQHFSEQEQLIQVLKQEISANTTILFKGSRSSHMEKVMQALMEYSKHECGQGSASIQPQREDN